MNILFVLEHFIPYVGGAEVLFYNLIKGLLKEGYKITVLTSRFDKNLLGYEKIYDGIQVYRVGHNRYDFMFYLRKKGYNLAKRADIIHTTTYNAAIPSWILAKMTGKKIVITVHEIFGSLWKKFIGRLWPFFRLYEKCIFLFPFDTYICVSNYTKDMLSRVEKISYDKMVTIYNGIDYNIWSTNEDTTNKSKILRSQLGLEENYVGFFFGRPGISKGLEYFIKAIPSIVDRIPHFKAYLLVSKDDKKRFSYIKNIVKELHIEQYIVRGEKVPYTELPLYVLMADFTIVPSLVEGFGFAAVEACSMGKPVIVTTGGSLPEVVSGKVCFVAPGDKNDIYEKIVNLYEHNSIYETQIKRFLREDNIQKTLLIYNKILGK